MREPTRIRLRDAMSVTASAVMLAASPALAADIGKGGRIYSMHCASCHGPGGMSVMPGAPNFARNERLLQPDVMLLGSVRNGKNAMPAYVGILNDREILDVIAYLRTLLK